MMTATCSEWSRITAADLDGSSVTVQGSYVKVNGYKVHRPLFKPEKRGACRGFTLHSRRRLIHTLAKMQWDAMPRAWFVTLTYPDECVPWHYGIHTRFRSQWTRDLENAIGHTCSTIWRSEYVQRKSGEWVHCEVPHWHLMVIAEEVLTKKWVHKTWARIIGYDAKVQVDVKECDTSTGALKYLSKYVSKEKCVDHGPLDNRSYLNKGRPWGITRKALIAWHPVTVTPLNGMDEVEEALYVCRRIVGGANRWQPGSYTLIGDWSERFKKEYLKNRLDGPGKMD